MMLFYIVKTSAGYAVWELTQEEMLRRLDADPTLKDRLNNTPFKTRQEAEKRRAELNASK